MELQEVVYPILVPVGKYCWKYTVTGSCDYFGSEGGHPSCELKFDDQRETKEGVLKDPKCNTLKNSLV